MSLEGEASSATGKSKSGGHKARARACQALSDTQSCKSSPDVRRRDCGGDTEHDRVSSELASAAAPTPRYLIVFMTGAPEG